MPPAADLSALAIVDSFNCIPRRSLSTLGMLRDWRRMLSFLRIPGDAVTSLESPGPTSSVGFCCDRNATRDNIVFSKTNIFALFVGLLRVQLPILSHFCLGLPQLLFRTVCILSSPFDNADCRLNLYMTNYCHYFLLQIMTHRQL